MHLTHISSPEDVRALDAAALPELCGEIRQTLLENAAAIGGHLGSNLGVVELTVALHRVFHSPTDKIVFDVSHQTYTHKILTGRADAFTQPERFGSVSGFSKPAESPHDLFSMGHTSTSVSLACGLAKARDLAGETYDVVAVIGDGSLSGGLAFEGLDNAAELGSGLIIIVNDNDQSIAENHGGLYRTLARLRESGGAAPDNYFRALGLDYRYLEDGNDVHALVDALEDLRGCTHPCVLHVRTTKGCGFEPAERNPEGWHHIGPFDPARAAAPKRPARGDRTYAQITADHLLQRMREDPRVVAISAATPYIMGFTPELRAQAGAQFVDTGIAEEHAVSFATALAAAGAKPVFGVYGTFLQRGYDQLWHDLSLNRAPATILVFGASVFGTTDETHLSFFDIPLLSCLPGLRYLAPCCEEEYLSMLDWSLDQRECPCAIRVPGRGVVSAPRLVDARVRERDWTRPAYQVLRHGSDLAILALGDFLPLGKELAARLGTYGVHPTLVNPRFATELDGELLSQLGASHRAIITLEDGILEGGWGEKVARFLGTSRVRVRCHGIRRGFPDHFDPQTLLAENGMALDALTAEALELLR